MPVWFKFALAYAAVACFLIADLHFTLIGEGEQTLAPWIIIFAAIPIFVVMEGEAGGRPRS